MEVKKIIQGVTAREIIFPLATWYLFLIFPDYPHTALHDTKVWMPGMCHATHLCSIQSRSVYEECCQFRSPSQFELLVDVFNMEF